MKPFDQECYDHLIRVAVDTWVVTRDINPLCSRSSHRAIKLMLTEQSAYFGVSKDQVVIDFWKAIDAWLSNGKKHPTTTQRKG